MTRPYSNDLRERVIAAVVDGQSCRVVAERFDIAVSSVVNWSQRYRATGRVSPGKMGGHRRRVLEPHRAFIVEQIERTSHLTLHRLKDEFKKTLFALEQGRADIARRGARWRAWQDRFDPKRLFGDDADGSVGRARSFDTTDPSESSI